MTHNLLLDETVLFHYTPNVVLNFPKNPRDSEEGTGKSYSTVFETGANVRSLKEILELQEANGKTEGQLETDIDTEIRICLGVTENENSAAILVKGKVFERLRRFGLSSHDLQVKVTVIMKRFHYGVANEGAEWRDEYLPFISTSTKEMDIYSSFNKNETDLAICYDTNVALPTSVLREWTDLNTWIRHNRTATLALLCTVKVSFHHDGPKILPMSKMCRKILDEAVSSDMVIESADGKEIPCHKSFLTVNSPVLRRMMDEENKMKESTSGRVEMADMSEKGARAFLQFLYYRDVSVPLEDSSVALELFNAAEKYEILELKSTMENLFMKNDKASWWTVDVTVRLFLLANKIDSGKGTEIKKKSLEILRRNYAQWKTSKFFEELRRDEPEAVAELFDGALTFLS